MLRHGVVMCGALVALACETPPASPPTGTDVVLEPVLATDALPHDADDPAVWRHPTDPARSLIIGTDKTEIEGGLYVFGIDGRLRQAVTPLDRPNNVDVEYGLRLAGGLVDIAVTTERKQHRLRVFGISPDGVLRDLAPEGLPVLEGESGEAAEPMGIALYRRRADGAVFAIVAPKTAGATDYLWQYRLSADAGGGVTASLVRRFGAFSQIGAGPGEIGEIEAVVVDDALGYVYYSDERFGIRKYLADPDADGADAELAVFGQEHYLGDREGLGIYETGPASGYIVSSDQLPGGTRVHLFPREGGSNGPHDHPLLVTLRTASDDTDGLEVSAMPLPGFPRGVLVMMNAGPRNFLIYDWEAVARAAGLADPRGPAPSP